MVRLVKYYKGKPQTFVVYQLNRYDSGETEIERVESGSRYPKISGGFGSWKFSPGGARLFKSYTAAKAAWKKLLATKKKQGYRVVKNRWK